MVDRQQPHPVGDTLCEFGGALFVGAGLLGAFAAIVAYVIVSAVERRAIPWYISLRDGEA